GAGERRCILVTLEDEDAKVVIKGITIKNGFTEATNGYGAGIYLDHTKINAGEVKILDCLISGNSNASPYSYNQGGGLSSRGRTGSAFHTIIENCLISGNVVTGKKSTGGGAAFLNTRLTMKNCRIKNNRAAGDNENNHPGFGGGIDVTHLANESVVSRTQFHGNFALSTNGSGGGGALHVSGEDMNLIVEECTFEDNEARWGAVVMQPNGKLMLRKCRTANNLGKQQIYLGWGKSAATTSIVDCTLDGGIRSVKRAKQGDFMLVDNSWRGSRRDPLVFTDKDGGIQPVRTVDDWKSRRSDIVQRIEAVAGALPDRSLFPSPEIKVLQDDVIEGTIRRQKIEYFSDSKDNPRIRAWLFSPTAKSSLEPGNGSAYKRAAILCLHQTTRYGKDEPAGLEGNEEMFYALELARRGFVTLAPDYVGFGEYSAVTTFSNKYASVTMKGVVDHMRAMDILSGLPGADPERIGCIGHSLGGFNAMFVSMFDPRIKVIVSSGGYVSWRGYADLAGDLKAWANPKVYMPLISSKFHNDPDLMPFDLHEFVAALAPRPFFVNAPLHDNICAVDGVRETLIAARPVYKLLGALDALQSEHPDCGHAFPPEVREKAYQFLEKYLATEDQ
ncbi:MAG: dienelactone hydrolase, partial [Verrucomicrobiales bacterium]